MLFSCPAWAFSLLWLPCCRGSIFQAPGLGCPTACGFFPDQGWNLVSSSLRGGFLVTWATRAVPRVLMLTKLHGWFQESLIWWHFSLFFLFLFFPRKMSSLRASILQSWTTSHYQAVFFPFHTSSVTSFWFQLIGHMDISSHIIHWRRVAGTCQTHSQTWFAMPHSSHFSASHLGACHFTSENEDAKAKAKTWGKNKEGKW